MVDLIILHRIERLSTKGQFLVRAQDEIVFENV